MAKREHSKIARNLSVVTKSAGNTNSVHLYRAVRENWWNRRSSILISCIQVRVPIEQ